MGECIDREELTMNLILFCSAFILQFVGHRIGDYFLQTDWQAQNKPNNAWARFKHCFVYSLTIGLLMLIVFDWWIVIIVYAITLAEHMYIDRRKPVTGWKDFLETGIAGRTDFEIEKMPFFVLIEIDQTIHIMRIFVISLLIAYGIL